MGEESSTSNIENFEVNIKKSYITNSEIFTINSLQPVAYMCIASIKYVVYSKELIPNRFVRFMQKHILGIIWKMAEEGD